MNSEIEKVQEQLAETENDPNLVILECFCWSENGEYNCKDCSVYLDYVKKYPNNHIRRY